MSEPRTDQEPCAPLRLDFDRLAADVTGSNPAKSARITGRARLRIVEHAIGHLREETGLDDRQIAKVMLTASVVLSDMVAHIANLTTIGCANWLALCGERLWREDGASTPSVQEHAR